MIVIGLLKRWIGQTGAYAVLLAPFFFAGPVQAQGSGGQRLFTLSASPNDASAVAYDAGSRTAQPTRTSAPVRPIPPPLTAIPYSGSGSPSAGQRSSGDPMDAAGTYYYYDETGKLITGTGSPNFSSNVQDYQARGRGAPLEVKPKFDYSLAPIQPARRPRRAFAATPVVAAESAATSNQPISNSLVRQDKILSADEFSSRRTRSTSNNGSRNQQSNNMRRIVTIENVPSSRGMIGAPPQKAPKCRNCGKRLPAASMASLPNRNGANR